MLLLAILIKFIYKGRSAIDRNIDSIVFCPSDIPNHVVEEFQKMKDNRDCKRHGAYNNDAGSACIRYKNCQPCPQNGTCP
jgi:hypothetical protein